MFGSLMPRRVLFVALGACLAASACTKRPEATPPKSGGSQPAAKVQQVPTVTITVQGSGFSPASVTLSPGTNVIWVQSDDKASHSIVSGTPGHPDSKFSSIALKKGASFTIAPQAPGTYSYYDGEHTSFTGTVAVSGPATSTSPSPSKSK
jgi:plastocyanin